MVLRSLWLLYPRAHDHHFLDPPVLWRIGQLQGLMGLAFN
jgi:hypothetical protein